MLLRTCVRAALAADVWGRRLATRAVGAARPATDDRGQATTEYGLVILVAGGIALGIIAWVGKTGSFTGLFEGVVKKLMKGL